MNYKLDTEPATKVIITITTEKLWLNFMHNMANWMWDDVGLDAQTNMIHEVAGVLLNGQPIATVEKELRQLFKKAYTCMLMGDAMKHIDIADPEDREHRLFEIVVIDMANGVETSRAVVRHDSICF